MARICSLIFSVIGYLRLHRVGGGMAQDIQIEARVSVAIQNGGIVIATWLPERFAFVHHVHHGLDVLAIQPYPHRFLAVQEREAFVTVEHGLVCGSQFPYQYGNAAAHHLGGGAKDRVCYQRYRLHRGMVSILLGLVEFLYGGLLAVGVPGVLAGLLPSEQDRFMQSLIRGAAEHQ